jgi:hypothetical protein
VGEPAVGQLGLPHGRPLRAGQEPPQELALHAGRQRGGVSGRVEEREQPADRVEQRRRPSLDFPAAINAGAGPVLGFGGATVDGVELPVWPMLLTSSARY